MKIKKIDKSSELDKYGIESVVKFLHKHLEEYGDKKKAIREAINYSFSEKEGKGGFLLLGLEKDKIIGAVVINKTGMKHYIPENILVYISTHKKRRGQGLGTKLMKKTIEETSGNIALHVEEDNPAVGLYKKLGFETKYLEMRYRKD
ncbi:MAG: GNAT family N-acetyltransferase [Candidatus Mcinerneyibacterium aminivorans]|jgi:ribosomal protein S18 acetylase RimI-like enzyme|uniref:GNAT family N-acetyltransferase n=1 Tax=Candidatus Mcinerneyibacterium aminivorans TaxID=2703815 RepID=A0A5D0MDA0_9BACT|nr:MAG: GNAT family N-acetyltransferase [Candidatus Mcinerneyibacterium aminivorans]